MGDELERRTVRFVLARRNIRWLDIRPVYSTDDRSLATGEPLMTTFLFGLAAGVVIALIFAAWLFRCIEKEREDSDRERFERQAFENKSYAAFLQKRQAPQSN